MIDLHSHTNYSDGELSPEALITEANRIGFKAVAVTDHDTLSGIAGAFKAGDGLEMEVISGIEFTTQYRGTEIHLLGYFLPIDDPDLNEYLADIAKAREKRGRMIIENVRKLGYDISYDDAVRVANFAPIMSPHILRAMREKGLIGSTDEAWQFYKEHLTEGADCAVPHSIDIRDAIEILKKTGCPSAVAHPHKLKNDDLVADVIKIGVDGLEAYYPDMDLPTSRKYRKWAEEEGLLATGGSDYHGVFTPRKLGSGNVPDEVLDNLKAVRDKMRSG